MVTFIKIILENIWKWVALWIWVILSIWIFGTIYAYTNLPTQTSGDQLTESIWNEVINKINDIWNRTNNISSVWGKIGIWATSPTTDLDVRGDIRYGSDGAHIKRAFYRYSNANSIDNQYIHIKTNQPLNSIMTTLKFYGYQYGGAKTIDAQISYYPYLPSNGPTSIGTSGTHTLNVYKSSDGYMVVTIFVTSTYYTGFYIDAFGPGPQGLFWDIAILATTNSPSATGVY